MAGKKRSSRSTKSTKTRAKKTASSRKVVKRKQSEVLLTSTMPSSTEKAQYISALKNPRIFIPLSIIIVAAVLFMAKGMFIAAMVNGQLISRMALTSELEKEAGKQVLNTLVTKTLIYQEAKKRGVSITDAQVNAQISSVEKTLKQQGQTLNEALAAKGITLTDFKEQIKIQLLVEKMLGKQIQVTDKEVDDYIANNPDMASQETNQDQLRTNVRSQLEQQKVATQAQAWLADLQKKAHITYFVNL